MLTEKIANSKKSIEEVGGVLGVLALLLVVAGCVLYFIKEKGTTWYGLVLYITYTYPYRSWGIIIWYAAGALLLLVCIYALYQVWRQRGFKKGLEELLEESEEVR